MKSDFITALYVNLDKENAVYFPGDNVTGSVRFTVKDCIKIRGVRIKFSGKALAKWTETETTGSGDNQTTDTIMYKNKQTYFKTRVVLAGKDSDQPGADLDLNPNDYIYPFSFLLPSELPSSFEGLYGHIRYKIKSTIDIPCSFDKESHQEFTVIGKVDLNTMPEARHPKSNYDSKTICCWCCESGPITARMSMNKTGYVPGEAIVMTGEVENNSNRKIGDCHILLEQTSVFKARRLGYGYEHTRCNTKMVAKTESAEILPGDSLTIGENTFQVPSLPPSYIPLCGFISIQYQLTLKAKPTGPSLKLTIPFDIIIGTVPLQDHFYPSIAPFYQPFTSAKGLTSKPGTKYAPVPVIQQEPLAHSTPLPDSEIPQPSYDECVYATEMHGQKEEVPTNWRPAYPFYY